MTSNEPDWMRLDVAAELARQYGEDQREFLELLAMMLETAMPGHAEIQRKGGLFSKKTVHRIAMILGENQYVLEDPGRGALQASKTHVVRGIALKNEPIPVEQWVAELAEGLQREAKVSAAARQALSKLVK